MIKMTVADEWDEWSGTCCKSCNSCGDDHVVHCIDCKHYCESNIRQFYFCTAWCMDFNREMHDPEKYFCADGERREDGEAKCRS